MFFPFRSTNNPYSLITRGLYSNYRPQDQGIQSHYTSPHSTAAAAAATTTTLSKMALAVTLLMYIQEMADSILGRDTGNPD
jgi:hypothetical protein